MKIRLTAAALLFATAACTTTAPPPAAAPVVVAAPEQAVDHAAEDQRLLAFLDAAFDAQAARSPQFLTSLGSKEQYDRLNT